MNTSEPLTVRTVLQKAAGYLGEKGLATPRLDAEVLLAFVLDLDRVHLYVNFDRPLDRTETDRYRELVAARAKRVPVAHLRGFKEFFGLRFAVSSEVLIPRPETEILVQEVLGYLARVGFAVRQGAWCLDASGSAPVSTPEAAPAAEPVPEPSARPRLLDLATGSGAIAVALANYAPDSLVTGTDLSEAALRIAQANAEALGVGERVEFCRGDLFEAVSAEPEQAFDVIASNPPYIPTTQLADLEPDIRYEPRQALDGGRDGLDFYRRIAPAASDHLKPGGLLALEIGHDQGAAVTELLVATGRYREPRVVRDYAQKDRVVLAETTPRRG